MGKVVLRFDMRCPQHSATSARELYAAAVEMSRWADGRGVDVIGLSEHHNTDDGYLPSPLTLAAAIAVSTSSIKLSIGALLVPLYDPIRLAENIAVLDNLAPGRLTLITGIGYRESEYQALGREWARRGQLLEDNIHTLQTAWKGQPFEFHGRQVQVLPRPATRPHPLLAIGGNSRLAARRAARLGLPFFPAIDDPALVASYHQACSEAGFTQGFVMLPDYPATTYLAEDVEQGWQDMGAHMLYDALAYGRWHHPTRRAYAESSATSIGQLRAEGKYRVLQPQRALELLRAGESLHLAPLVGGAAPELGWRSLRLFTEQVAPQLG
jgi:alkanesulfonate monooxygenase SsuD/methylene tetrahydromethanopterin reductase-like flavin-dependent oxidoreductase (luciferase family)